jgi:hypothetical protein
MKIKYKNKNYLFSKVDGSVWQIYDTDKPNRLLDQRSKIAIAIKNK